MNRDILRLAVPALGALAADPLVSLVDTAFVGRLGEIPLAALGVNAAIFGVAFFVFNFLAYGTTPLVAGAEARREHDQARGVVSAAGLMAVALGLVGLGVLATAGEAILDLMQTPRQALADALVYLRIRSLAVPAVLLILVGHGAFRGRQDTKTPLVVTAALNAVNLVLDPILIFGFGWGLAGAAAATTIAQWMGALWFVILLRQDWVGVSAASRRLSPLVRVAGDLTIRTLALLAALTFATAVAADAGVSVVAGHQVVSQLWLFSTLVLDALAVAGQALVGRAAGEAEPNRIDDLARRLASWGLLGGAVLGVAFAVGLPLIPSLFGVGGGAADEIAGAALTVAIIQPIGALVFVGDGLYIGASRFRLLTVSTVVAGAAAVGYFFAADPTSLRGIWVGIAILLVVRLGFQLGDYLRNGGLLPASSVGHATEARS